jgi:hypothetical protein
MERQPGQSNGSRRKTRARRSAAAVSLALACAAALCVEAGAASPNPTSAYEAYYLHSCTTPVGTNAGLCNEDNQGNSGDVDRELNRTGTNDAGDQSTANNHVVISHTEGASGIGSATIRGDANGSAKKVDPNTHSVVPTSDGSAQATFSFEIPEGAPPVDYTISASASGTHEDSGDSHSCATAVVQLTGPDGPVYTESAGERGTTSSCM